MELSERAVSSLAFTAVQFAVALACAMLVTRRHGLSIGSGLAVLWYAYDSIVHVTLEGPFVYLSLTGTVASASGFFAEVWKEYGLADSRWALADPTIVALEILTVFFCTPLCVMMIYGIAKRRWWRHFVQIVVNVCELYGGWMTFGPEWITGSHALDTSNPLYLWVYLVFFNMLWVVVPLALLYQSWKALAAAEKLKTL